MKYSKPQLVVSNIVVSETIATGLSEWLDNTGYDETVAQHITTFEVNS